MPTCPNCNSEISEGARFCHECGKRLGGESSNGGSTIIENVVEENKEKRERKSKIKEISEGFVMNVYSKLNETPPEYNPLGYYEGDKEWKTTIEEKGSAKGWIERDSSKTLEIECVVSKPSKVKDEVRKKRNNSKFSAKCFVLDKITSDLKQFVQNINHPSISIFVYDVSEDELIFNEKSEKAKLFSPWFSQKKPRKMFDLLKESVEGEVFDIEELENGPLNLKREEAKRLIKKLISEDEVLAISEGGETYAIN